MPLSLQYDDYAAADARAVSIAGGDPMEKTTNRSFRGKTIKTYNRDDMVMVQDTRKAMGQKPVVVVVETGRPLVLAEIEPYADAVLLSFNVQHQALLDLISGHNEPSALLPMQMPADMAAVEAQLEDVPRDMRCYRDADGHDYDFAFGMNWSGVIRDERVEKYSAQPLRPS
jgi:beta-glucosidase